MHSPEQWVALCRNSVNATFSQQEEEEGLSLSCCCTVAEFSFNFDAFEANLYLFCQILTKKVF